MHDLGIFHKPGEQKATQNSTMRTVLKYAIINNKDHIFSPETRYKPSRVAIVFNIPKSTLKSHRYCKYIFKKQKFKRRKIIVIERGYFLRKEYRSVGWNWLHGMADFKNDNSPSDRWRHLEKLGLERKDWRSTGEHIVICGQKPHDSSVLHIDYREWAFAIVNQIKQYTDRPIIFRHHPLQKPHKKLLLPPGIQESFGQIPLSEELRGAWAMVAYNSTSACESILQGIPTFVCDHRSGSTAYPVANKDIADIDNPIFYDREQWLYNIAYAQWTHAEIKQGIPFKHLRVDRIIKQIKGREERALEKKALL